MGFKGTKGKWYLQPYTDAYTNIIRCNNGVHETLYIAATSQDSGEETRLNALLISKAPELLEMLLEIHESYKNKGHLLDVSPSKIERLIKEATEL